MSIPSDLPRIPKPVPGFLFKIVDPKTNETKGYILGVEHSAEKETLQMLENAKIKSIFDKTKNFYFENKVRMINDLEEFSDRSRVPDESEELSVEQLKEYSANIIKLNQDPEIRLNQKPESESFAEFIGINRADIEHKKILPGLDYQLLMKVFEGKGMGAIHSLELKNDSRQWNATKETIQNYADNINFYFENFVDLKEFLKSEKSEHIEEKQNFSMLEILQIHKDKDKAWKTGEKERFLEELAKLDGDFFTKKRDNDDTVKQQIAFQRNREVNLAKKVHDLLSNSLDKNLYILGLDHPVTNDRVNLLELLKARGWVIHQIKESKK